MLEIVQKVDLDIVKSELRETRKELAETIEELKALKELVRAQANLFRDQSNRIRSLEMPSMKYGILDWTKVGIAQCEVKNDISKFV